jgi:hypothetical protein
MLRRLLVITMVALLAAPAVSMAQFKQGDWELTLSGNGANGPDFDAVSFAVNGSVGYFFTDQFEAGLRQTIGFSDQGPSTLNGSTRVFVDYHFDMDQWQPYVGANLGYAYGDAVSDTFFAAPEGGVKYFVNDTTFVFFSVEYQFFFDEAEEADEEFSDGQFLYGLGIGFRF